MQRKTKNIVLLLLLALLFSARSLTAQTGWQFFTVVGNPGGSGELSVQFSDADNDFYYATYWYGPTDNPTTAAAGLAYILTTTYGTNAFTVSPQGGTLSIAFTPYTIHWVGNGYFSNVWCTPDNGQTMYVVNNQFDFPDSTTSSPSSPDGSSASPDTLTLTVQDPDGGVTIYTNLPATTPITPAWGNIISVTQGVPKNLVAELATLLGYDPVIDGVLYQPPGGPTPAFPATLDQIPCASDPACSAMYPNGIPTGDQNMTTDQAAQLLSDTFDQLMAPVTITSQSTLYNDDGSTNILVGYSDGTYTLFPGQPAPPSSSGGVSGSCPGGCCQYGGCICGE